MDYEFVTLCLFYHKILKIFSTYIVFFKLSECCINFIFSCSDATS